MALSDRLFKQSSLVSEPTTTAKVDSPRCAGHLKKSHIWQGYSCWIRYLLVTPVHAAENDGCSGYNQGIPIPVRIMVRKHASHNQKYSLRWVPFWSFTSRAG